MKANDGLRYGRPIQVNGMAYAPISELGVVYLFGRLAPQLGFHVEYNRADGDALVMTAG